MKSVETNEWRKKEYKRKRKRVTKTGAPSVTCSQWDVEIRHKKKQSNSKAVGIFQCFILFLLFCVVHQSSWSYCSRLTVWHLFCPFFWFSSSVLLLCYFSPPFFPSLISWCPSIYFRVSLHDRLNKLSSIRRVKVNIMVGRSVGQFSITSNILFIVLYTVTIYIITDTFSEFSFLLTKNQYWFVDL